MSAARIERRLLERDVRQALGLERRALATGKWPAWQRTDTPGGFGSGWNRDVTHAFHNGVFAVLVRPVATPWGVVEHLAIRNASSSNIAWRDKQRIKDELFGPDRVAVEVFPPTAELVDEANMYHVWVLPPGFRLPFGI